MTAQTFSVSEEVLRVSLCVVVDDVYSLDGLTNLWIFYSSTHIFAVNVWMKITVDDMRQMFLTCVFLFPDWLKS